MNPAPVMVHPSAAPVIQAMPSMIQAPVHEVFVVIVSKHSPSCSKIFEMVKFVAPHLHTKILEIDHPDVRKLVLQSGKIKTVPTIALMYPQQHKVDFYEGPSALQLLQHKVEEVQRKIQSMMPPQKTTDIAQVLAPNPPSPQMPQQLPPPQMHYQEPVRMEHPQQPYPTREPYLPPMEHRNPDPNDMRANPLDRNIATVSYDHLHGSQGDEAPQQIQPQEIPGGMLIDETAYDVQMGDEPIPTGMSREEIMGADQGFINREKDKKSKANQSRMEAMIREREEMDKRSIADPRLARR